MACSPSTPSETVDTSPRSIPLRRAARCLRGIAFMLASSSAAIGFRNVTYKSDRVGQSASASQPAGSGCRKRNSATLTRRRRISPAAWASSAAAASASAASGPPYTQNGLDIRLLPNSTDFTCTSGSTPTTAPSRSASA